MADRDSTQAGASKGAEQRVAMLGAATGFAALLSAAACCVLPLAFAALGFGAGGLAILVPFHWPLTIGATLAVATGWAFYASKRRACVRDRGCTISAPAKATFWLLCFSTAFVLLSALWPAFFEGPLMRLLERA